jgi:hypothetical protein
MQQNSFPFFTFYFRIVKAYEGGEVAILYGPHLILYYIIIISTIILNNILLSGPYFNYLPQSTKTEVMPLPLSAYMLNVFSVVKHFNKETIIYQITFR